MSLKLKYTHSAMVVAGLMLSSASAIAQAAPLAFNTLDLQSSTVASFGLPNTAAYGQSFSVDSPFSFSSATFLINDNGTSIDVDLQVLAFDIGSSSASGTPLATGSGATAGISGLEEVTVAASSGAVLAPGEYVVFLQATSDGNSSWGTTPGDVISNGTFVFQNNGGDTVQLTEATWSSFSGLDLAFALNLAPILLAPAPSDTQAGTAAGAARLVVVDAAGVARDAGQLSLATRAERLSFTRSTGEDGAPLVTMSTQDSPGFIGTLHGWAQITAFYASDDSEDQSLQGRGIQVGLDAEVSPGLIAGLSIGASDIDTSDSGTQLDGELLFVQPYVSYRAGALSLEGTLLYGEGDFDQTGLGGDGEGDTELFAVTATGGYDFDLGHPGSCDHADRGPALWRRGVRGHRRGSDR